MSAVPADDDPRAISFRDLALSEPVLRALIDVGYESPSPIQAATIPVLLSGADMLGQAQTGTGKTAAFALPALTRIDLSKHEPQVLVLVPTRELALQVAEAFLRYAAHLKGFHVLPIYGGQSYQPQLNALRRGVHVVVGTPGRVIDHMNRETAPATRASRSWSFGVHSMILAGCRKPSRNVGSRPCPPSTSTFARSRSNCRKIGRPKFWS